MIIVLTEKGSQGDFARVTSPVLRNSSHRRSRKIWVDLRVVVACNEAAFLRDFIVLALCPLPRVNMRLQAHS